MSMYRLVALLNSINWLSSLPPLLIRLLVKPFKRKLLLLLVNWVLGKLWMGGYGENDSSNAPISSLAMPSFMVSS